MKHGSKASNSTHKGVSIIEHRGQTKLRWRDPISRKLREKGLGVLTKAEAVVAAKLKAEALSLQRKKFLTGELVTEGESQCLITQYINLADSPGTRNNRTNALCHVRTIQEGMQGRGWNEINRSDLHRLRTLIANLDNVATTKNHKVTICRSFFAWLSQRGQLGVIGMDIIGFTLQKFKASEMKHGKHFTQAEAHEVLSMLLKTRPDAALFYLLKLLLGLRIGELINIQSTDIVTGRGVPFLKVFSPKTNRSRKVNLAVSPLAQQILLALKARNHPGYLFYPSITKDRNPQTVYQPLQHHLYQTTRRKLGWQVNAKDCRTSSEAFLACVNGWTMMQVAKQIGHSITVCERFYSEDLNLMEITHGDTIEEIAGIENLGSLILQANGINQSEIEKLQQDTKRSAEFDSFIARLKERDLGGDKGLKSLKSEEWLYDQEQLQRWKAMFIAKIWDAEQVNRMQLLAHSHKANRILPDTF